jgi:hypothetical protein
VSQPLNRNTVKRLALIRFLYAQGLEQAKRPQPLSAAALLSFHDAVEMFLLLAAESLNVSLSKSVVFDGYWTEIAQHSGTQLPNRPAMRRMNNSRVNFKHHGSIPSAMDVQQFQGDVTTFLTDATQMVFGADFHGLEMTDLVTQARTLTLLRNAETQATQGDYTEALGLLSEAFDGLLKDYADRKRAAGGFQPFTFLPTFGFSRLMQGQHDRDLTNRIETVETVLEEMQRAMRVLTMGLDYRRYVQLKLLAPGVIYDLGGGRTVQALPGHQVGDDEYQTCKLFVIESALHLAELDFDLDLHEIVMEHFRQQQTTATRPGTTGT